MITQDIHQSISSYGDYDVRVQASLPRGGGGEYTTYAVYNDSSGRSCGESLDLWKKNILCGGSATSLVCIWDCETMIFALHN